MTTGHVRIFMQNKNKKRLEITKLCYTLILSEGFCNITVSQIAKRANIAKGSIYKYFESKEDILFSLIKSIQDEYDLEVKSEIERAGSVKQRVLALFTLCIKDDELNKNRRKIYKEFSSICLSKSVEKMLAFQDEIKKRYILWLREILSDGVKRGEIKESSIDLADGLFAMAEGVLLFPSYEPSILTHHLDVLFKLIKEERK